jgi:P4 family phage/plasmid primase-like protien
VDAKDEEAAPRRDAAPSQIPSFGSSASASQGKARNEQAQAEIERSISLLCEQGAVYELRIPDGGPARTVSGYFNDLEKLIAAVVRWDGKAPGIYATINPVELALLSRSWNCTHEHAKNTTADKNITRRRRFLVDADPVRPAGISSTDEEKAAAHEVALAVREYLSSCGWPAPILADSGNGYHLLYRVDLPNDDDSKRLIENCLKALAARFDTPAVSVDRGVYNAARISKVYGTLAAKGSDTPDRPHRRSRLVDVPDTLVPVSRELLETLAAEVVRPSSSASSPSPGRFDLGAWLREHAVEIKREDEYNGGKRYILSTCPFNSDHGAGSDTAVLQDAGGVIAFCCKHNGCADKRWQDFRAVYEATSAVEQLSYLSTDGGNAELFASEHRHELRHCHPWGKYIVWAEQRWAEDHTGAVDRMAKATVRGMLKRASELADEDARKRAVRHALITDSRGRREAMTALAASEADIPITPEQLDAPPLLLNVTNGTVDLHTGKLQPHQRGDLLTKLAPVAFDPAATCPRWDAFLAEVLPDPEVLAFVHKAVGYSLTASVVEQVLFFVHGPGANGKSVFLTIMLYILGDYGMQAVPDILVASKGDRHPTELADFYQKRLVATVEVEEGRRLAESLVKWLTGGDLMRARRMREDFWSFQPTHKLWLAANHRPVIRGQDYAIWRRIRLIPFTTTIPEARRDANLVEKLKLEAPGILRWAVDGCLAWQREGLRAPAAVAAATEGYREEQDIVGRFITDRCILGQNLTVKAGDLYRAFKVWCDATGERAMSQTAFGLRLGDRGLRNEHQRTGRWWVGVALLTDDRDGCDGFEAFSGYVASSLSLERQIRKTDETRHTRHTDDGEREPGCDDDLDDEVSQ